MRAIARFIVQKRALFYILFAALIVYCVFCIPRVKVEYEITTYLPKDTDTARALAIMDGEFVTYGSATALVKDIDYADAAELVNAIAAIDGVKEVPFSNTPDCYKDRAAKITITFDGTDKDEKAKAAYAEVIKKLDGSGHSYGVPTPLVNSYADTLAREMIVIIAISAAVILVVLLFTSKSFAEVLAFPLVFVVAAVLNMGTNYWLGTISFVSNTVCIILQLALAIDYAIILCHRFSEEREKAADGETAMIETLTKAIPEIASSALTTVSGLVALMFMQLRLGYDLGMVLAKSIICSLVTVFLLMPGLLILLDKLIQKSRHRNFVPKLRFWGKGVIKARYVFAAAFVALFAAGAVVSQRVDYVYSTKDIDTSRPTPDIAATRECEEIFGHDNMFVIIVPKGDSKKEREILDLVAEEPLIDSALGMTRIPFGDGYINLSEEISSSQFAKLTGIDQMTAFMLFTMYGRNRATPLELFEYIIERKDALISAGFIDGDMAAMLDTVGEKLDGAKKQLVGKHYSRLVFNIAADTEDERTFDMIGRLIPLVKAINPDAIFAGASMSAYDLNQSFSSDNILITVLTILFIYIILAITFRSPLLPAVLVLVIQGAIFMNFSIPVIGRYNIFFFTYLIISSIQMGATIDYAILLTNRFKSLYGTRPKREAMTEAVSAVFPTVFTSGTIMCVAGFLVGRLTSDPLISSMGTSLGYGTIISILSVLTFLPSLLYMLYPFLEKTIIKPRRTAKRLTTPNPSQIPFAN